MDLREAAEDIRTRFLEQGVTVPTSDIEQRLNSLVYDFKVPIEEARRSVVSYFAKLHPKEGVASETEVIYAKITDINAEDRWINLRVRVVQLWEPNSPSIAQVGLLGDEHPQVGHGVGEGAGNLLGDAGDDPQRGGQAPDVERDRHGDGVVGGL